jgi:trehalose synthase
MATLEHVPIEAMDPYRFGSVLSPAQYEQLLDLIEHGASQLRGRVIWNVNSTAKGGGVVELLRPLLGYSRGGGVDARWVVVSGRPAFFELTKRIHNHLHGFDGDGGPLGAAERDVYEDTLADNAREFAELVSPQDVVILHDPQTAGLVPAVRETGAQIIWRCHVGLDHPNDYAREAWDFLRSYVELADAYVFSRKSFAWEGLDQNKITVIQPTVDAFAPKNAEQTREQSLAILASAGIIAHEANADPLFTRSDGTPGRVDRRADMVEVDPLRVSDRVVVQVSRWDRLKDPLGVINGFVDHVAPNVDAHLVLAGPSTESVADDPEGAGILTAVNETWAKLPDDVRRRVHLASLPMADIEENAAIVNALQRHADVVVQKSLAEGFGLTVSEAMWKARPVVGSRVGGIQDQIQSGQSGVLISDPHDLTAYGEAVTKLLTELGYAREMGDAAKLRVRDHFLGPYSLMRYFGLIYRLIGGSESTDTPSV